MDFWCLCFFPKDRSQLLLGRAQPFISERASLSATEVREGAICVVSSWHLWLWEGGASMEIGTGVFQHQTGSSLNSQGGGGSLELAAGRSKGLRKRNFCEKVQRQEVRTGSKS